MTCHSGRSACPEVPLSLEGKNLKAPSGTDPYWRFQILRRFAPQNDRHWKASSE